MRALRKHSRGPDYLTLYSFSLENWKRPASEVTFLMQMYIDYLRQERPTMMENNIRFRQIGRLDNLPDPVLDEVERRAGRDEEQRRPDARARAELRQPRRDHRRGPRDRR
jgi:undecaprenyl diphosphate synthase